METKTSGKKHLELEVSDFGPIEQAKVELRPLTVFVGPSNTGKSYLAILIYSLHSFFWGYAQQDRVRLRFPSVRVSRYSAKRTRGSRPGKSAIHQMSQWAREVMEDNESGTSIHMPPEIAQWVWKKLSSINAEQVVDEIRHAFGADIQVLKRHNASDNATLIIRSEASKVTSASFVEHRLSISDASTFSLHHPPGLPLDIADLYGYLSQLDVVLNDSLEDMEYEGALYRKEIIPEVVDEFISAAARNAVSILTNPLTSRAYYLPADRTGIMHAHQLVVSSLIRSATHAGLRSEAPLGTLSGVLADFLENLIELHEVSTRNQYGGILANQIEQNMLSGAILNEKRISGYPFFSYQPDGWQQTLPLMNTSSMVSELAPVVLYLRHIIQSGDVLIIEEPEAHLHPAMQREFTRQIAAMVQAGVRVVITTHSEWVLEELANLVYLSQVSKDRTSDFEGSSLALEPDQVGVWLFEPKNQPRGSVVREIPLDIEMGSFDSGFAEVMESLYSTWAKLTRATQADSE